VYPPGAGTSGDASEAEGLTLRDYLAVVWRRKWIIILVTVVATAAAYFFAARQPDMYMASTDLIYESQIDVANPLSQYGYTDPYERDLEMRAITNILASPDMIKRAEALLDGLYDGEYASNVPGGGASPEAGGTDASSSEVPGYSVASSVPESNSNSAVGSNVVSISGTSTEPALASDAANAYALAFVAWRKERQQTQIEKAIGVVQDQMGLYADAAKTSADYLILQQRLRDLQILKGTASGNYRVLVPAQKPGAPFEPRPLRSAILGLGVGLFAAIGLAFLLEQFDTRLRRQDEIAHILRQPILGRIPRISKRMLGESAMVTLKHSEGQAAEAFRMIRTNLEFMSVDADIGSLIVTSCVQGEGKSVSVANLAVTMAMSGKKVVVVDGDLRRPRLHTYFGVENKVGVSTVATGKTALAQALEPVELAPNEGHGGEDFAEWARSADARSRLFVLPSGPLPPNPGEIVNSRRFGQMIQSLEKEADLVIVDSPAMLAVGDTAALAGKVDGLVFLVDMHLVKRPALLQAAEQLAKLPVKLLGVVVRTDGAGGGKYGYYGSYGSPYGYSDGQNGRDGRDGGPTKRGTAAKSGASKSAAAKSGAAKKSAATLAEPLGRGSQGG
jgi:Mrp family chromosome partitioning ATPase